MADASVRVLGCNSRLASGQVQLKTSERPGAAPGWIEDQAQLKTVKSGQLP